MAYSKTFLFLGLVFVVVLLISSEASARELAETAQTQENGDGGHEHGHRHEEGHRHGHGHRHHHKHHDKPGHDGDHPKHGAAGEELEG